MPTRTAHRIVAAFFLAAATFAAVPAADAATTINVPAEHATIQDAIDAATAGDTIMVAPGTYFENIDFLGKDITVRSSGGAKVTIIDGRDLAPVVKLITGETAAAVLRGFTIQNGRDVGQDDEGGGVMINESSPTIRNNIIRRNIADTGGGIYVRLGSPLIEGNTIKKNKGCQGNGIELRAGGATVRDNMIRDNFRGACGTTADGGGGIRIAGGGSPVIVGNVISGNSNEGGGIATFGFEAPQIIGNTIVDNVSYETAGGIHLWAGLDAVVINNLIARNTVTKGAGGIFVDANQSSLIRIANNTIYGNVSTWDKTDGISGDEWGDNSVIVNNIISAVEGEAISCDVPPPLMENNNLMTSGPVLIGTNCSDLLAGGRNLNVDPQMFGPDLGDFSLRPTSPMIDAADDDQAPTDDFFGTLRPVDGDEDGQARADIGAIELAVPYITGVVTAAGTPVDSVCVHAYSAPNVIAAHGATNKFGEFLVAPPAGSHRLLFEDCTRGLFLTEWFDDAESYGNAATVDTSAGSVGGIVVALSFADLCNGKEPTMWGSPGDDTITGTAGPDVIVGRGGDDVISGGGGKDTICGDAGDDILEGGSGHDVLIGNSGDDLFEGGSGDDDIRGGGGSDEVTYFGAAVGVIVDLGAGTATGVGNDVVDNIENVRGTDHNDLIVGDGARNRLVGERGNDTLKGLGGKDILKGGDGADSLDGGAGKDDLSGASGDDRLWGRGGDDELAGGFDEDILQGGRGDDVMLGGVDNDLFLGGPGDDTITGAGGSGDTVSFQFADGPVVVDLGSQTATGEGTDTFTSIESAVGSKFADTLIGSDGDNTLYGLGGTDTLSGGPGRDILDGGGKADALFGQGGRDLLLGGTGNDSLDGGVGADTASWQFSANPVVASLTTWSSTGEGADTFVSIEDLVGSALNDTLIGNNGENFLFGLAGEDKLWGRSWRDALFGGDGNDTLYGEEGDDYLDGEKGSDTLNGGVGNDACIDGESHVSCETIQDIAVEFATSPERSGVGFDVVATWFRDYVRPF